VANINTAATHTLDAAGIQTVVADKAGCCGAIYFHQGHQEGGLADMRRSIDAWWPLISSGQVEAIVMNASGCGVTVKDCGNTLAHDPAYAQKAERVSALTRDLSELLPELWPLLQEKLGPLNEHQLAFHPQCTLQHGQQLRGGVEKHLTALGFQVSIASDESHLCCGSDGTSSVLRPKIAYEMRNRKLWATWRTMDGRRTAPKRTLKKPCRSLKSIPHACWRGDLCGKTCLWL
jgi:glycolate oxidase iron-sulfur subunit